MALNGPITATVGRSSVKSQFYRVFDDAESPMVFRSKEEALEYVGELLEGISPGFAIQVSIVEMTEAEYGQLPEM